MESLIVAEPMQSEKIGKLAHALSRAQGQMEGAEKSTENSFFKSKYADLFHCISAAKKPLSDNELAVIQTTEISDTGFVVITTLAHSSGEWIRGKIKMNPKKDDDQGRGSSLSYARRYAYTAIVGLAQKDDDGNSSSGNKSGQQEPVAKKPIATKKVAQRKSLPTPTTLINEDQRKRINILLTETNSNITGFLKHFEVQSVGELDTSQYAQAVKRFDTILDKIAKEGENESNK